MKRGKWTRLGATLHEALSEYARIHEAPQGTMSKLIDDTLAYLKPHLAKSTAKQYEGAAKILKRKLKEFRPEQVLPKHVAAIKVSMVGTPNMANRCLSFLRQVFDYALEHGKVDANPALGIKRYKEAKRKRLPSISEYDAVYAQAKPRLQVIADLLRLGGQRVSDTLRIRHADLLAEGIRFEARKTDKPVIVKWNAELRAVVERAKTLNGNVRALTLLQGRLGKPPDYRSIKLQWDNACEAAGVEDLWLHDLRAMALTQAKKEGKDPTALGRHSSQAMTERYLRDREIPVVEGPSFGRPLDTGEKKS